MDSSSSIIYNFKVNSTQFQNPCRPHRLTSSSTPSSTGNSCVSAPSPPRTISLFPVDTGSPQNRNAILPSSGRTTTSCAAPASATTTRSSTPWLKRSALAHLPNASPITRRCSSAPITALKTSSSPTRDPPLPPKSSRTTCAA